MGSKGTDKLEGAYALMTPEDSVRYYRDFAESYDEGFAAALGYVYPREVARAFLAAAGAGDRPVLDIGAGTGLVAEHLRGLAVDGIDISAEMLAKAGAKGLYRARIVADLTRPLAIPDAAYGGFVSAGTFTHGHLGPEVLGELLRIARPGALFCLGINLQVFDGAGFGSAFARLVAAGRISPLDFREVPIYEGKDHPHAGDRGVVALFRRR
jgi:SAM-dependent methyltransferase